MSSETPSKSVEERVTETLRERFASKEPEEEEKKALLREHQHHLIRETTSKLSVDAGIDVEGMEAESEIEVPDTYCFTCGEWVGLSGVDLRGTPRSKADAYYLGGPPEAVEEISSDVRETLAALAARARDDLPRADTLEDGAEFVSDELEQLQNTLKDGDFE